MRRVVAGGYPIVDGNRIHLAVDHLTLRLLSMGNVRGPAITYKWDKQVRNELACAARLLAIGHGGAN